MSTPFDIQTPKQRIKDLDKDIRDLKHKTHRRQLTPWGHPPSGGSSFGSGGGISATTLAALTDTDIPTTTPTPDGQVLTWIAADSLWKPKSATVTTPATPIADFLKWWDETDNLVVAFLRDTIAGTLKNIITEVTAWWTNLSYPWQRGADTGILDSLSRVVWGERFTKNQRVGSVLYGPTIDDYKDVTLAITANPLVKSDNTRARTFWEFLEVHFSEIVKIIFKWWDESDNIAIKFLRDVVGKTLATAIKKVGEWWTNLSYPWQRGADTGILDSLSRVVWGERFTKNQRVGSVLYGPTIDDYKDVTLAITANPLVKSDNTRARTFWEFLEVHFSEIVKIIFKWWDESDNIAIKFLRDVVGKTLATAIKKVGEWWNNLSYPWQRGADTGILDSLSRVVWGERFTKNQRVGSVLYGPTIDDYKDVTLAITANPLVKSDNTRARTFWEFLESNIPKFTSVANIVITSMLGLGGLIGKEIKNAITFILDELGGTIDGILKVANGIWSWATGASYTPASGTAGADRTLSNLLTTQITKPLTFKPNTDTNANDATNSIGFDKNNNMYLKVPTSTDKFLFQANGDTQFEIIDKSFKLFADSDDPAANGQFKLIGKSVKVKTDDKLFNLKDIGGGSSIDLTSIDSTITPDRAGARNIGSPTLFFNNGYFDEVILRDDLDVGGDVDVDGDVDVVGNVDVGGDVDVIEDLSIGGDVDVDGDVDVGGAVDVDGDVTVKGEIDFASGRGGGSSAGMPHASQYVKIKVGGVEKKLWYTS